MKLYVYPAILFERNEEYFVSIPDLNLLVVADDEKKAFLKAKDSLKAYVELAKRYESEIPFPSTFDEVKKQNAKDAGKQVIMLDVAVPIESVEQTTFDNDYNRFMKMFFDEE